MNTLYVNYTRSGRAISDHIVEKELFDQASICINGQDKQFNVSTENVIAAVRYMKMNEMITCNVEIMFEGESLPMNEYCVIDRWPVGFCDYQDRWITELLSLQVRKRKENNK
jgi:hypothetical protein